MSRSSVPNPHRRRHDALIASLAALSLAGCQAAPTVTPSLSIGQPNVSAPVLPQFQLQPDRRGGGDTYFTLSLPPEAPLPKQTVVVSGTPGAMETRLSTLTTPKITNVIPNGTGLILEGVNLDKSSLAFILGANPLTIGKRSKTTVTLSLPKGAQSSGILTVRDGTTTVLRCSADVKNVYVNGRVVVRFADGLPRTAVETALKGAGILYYRYPGMNFVVAYYSPDLAFDTVRINLLAQQVGGRTVFEEITRDTLYKGQGGVTVDDSRFAEQWALPMIKAPEAWTYANGSPDAIVAILDTGAALTHPDLAPNVFVNTYEVPGNNKDDDSNGRIDDVNGWNSYDQTGNVTDDNGHGTEMAGIIAAVANNKQGIAGVAYNCRFMPVKVMNSAGLASSSSLIDGINYAVRNRASVINLSLGSLVDDQNVKRAIDFAISFNVSVVAAMGNDGAKILEYPAAWSRETGLIAVGATNEVDVRPNWGTWGDWMTVSAPGEAVLTTSMTGYTVASGSSHAAAYTSGYAAVIKAAKPNYTPAMIKDTIVSTAVDRGTAGFDPYYGYGRINMSAALGNILGAVDLSASSEHFTGNFPVELANDKSTETFWSSARRYQDNREWLMADAGKPVSLTSVALLSAPYYAFLFPADFTIEVSKDGTSWTAVASERDFQIGESTWHRWNFGPVTAQYARLNVTRSRINPDNGMYYDQVGEIALNGEENAIIRTSSSNYYGWPYPTPNLTDGKDDTFWVSANRKAMQPEFAIADLGVSKPITSFDLLSPPHIISEAFPKKIAFYVSNDKVNWTYVQEFDNIKAADSTWYKFPVKQTSGRYVRVDVVETNFARSNGALYAGYELAGYTAAIAEVKVNRP